MRFGWLLAAVAVLSAGFASYASGQTFTTSNGYKVVIAPYPLGGGQNYPIFGPVDVQTTGAASIFGYNELSVNGVAQFSISGTTTSSALSGTYAFATEPQFRWQLTVTPPPGRCSAAEH